MVAPGTMVVKVPSAAAVMSWEPSTRPPASVTASVKDAGTPAPASPRVVTSRIVPDTGNRSPRTTVASCGSSCAVSSGAVTSGSAAR